MRIALTVVVAVVLAAAGSAAEAGQGTAGGRATLKLVDATPLKLRGTAFLAGERVRVTVSARATKAKRVTANAAGSFVVAFPGFSHDRCNALTAFAVGSQGSQARLKIRAQPQCPPML